MGSSVKTHSLALCVYQKRGTQCVYKIPVEKERYFFYYYFFFLDVDLGTNRLSSFFLFLQTLAILTSALHLELVLYLTFFLLKCDIKVTG